MCNQNDNNGKDKLKKKNYAVLFALLAMVAMFFLVTVIRLGTA